MGSIPVKHKLLFGALLLINICIWFAVELEWSGLFNVFFLSNHIVLGYYFLFSRKSPNISGLHKCFVLTLSFPPALHLLIQVFTGMAPRYVIPFPDAWEASLVTLEANCLVLMFLNLFSLNTKLCNLNIKREVRTPGTLAFLVLIIQALVFSVLSNFNSTAAVLAGGYGMDVLNVLGSINAWPAMAGISLILSLIYMNPRRKFDRIIFSVAALIIIVSSAAIFGKRADVIGFALIGVTLITQVRSVKRMAFVMFFSIFIFSTAAVIGYLRSSGLEHADTQQIRLIDYGDDNFLLPSVTDFYGTLPYVLSYTELDSGELWYGRSYYYALRNILPAAINPFRIDESAITFLQQQYLFYNGGMYFLGELCLNFGALISVLLALLFATIFNRATRSYLCRVEHLYLILSLALILGFPRWLLYGSSAFTKHLFLIFIFWLEGYVIWKITTSAKAQKRSRRGRGETD